MTAQKFFAKTALASLLASAGLLAGAGVAGAQSTQGDAGEQGQDATPAATMQRDGDAAAAPKAERAPGAAPQASGADAAQASSVTQGSYLTAQETNQILGSELIGMEVQNGQDQDEKIGKISDVILDRDGDIRGIVVGVGGFLGVGEKDVGMPWDRIQGVDADDKTVRANVTKDELKDAPEYETLKDK